MTVALINPKYAHNVGAAVRACACYGVEHLFFTGDRVTEDIERLGRIPREERMRGYADVKWEREPRFFDRLAPDVVPVCVEVSEQAEALFDFVHPERACYVFGPEDGGVPQWARALCHRFVQIPTLHCTNLAAAIYTVLYDRALKDSHALAVHRAFQRDRLRQNVRSDAL